MFSHVAAVLSKICQIERKQDTVGADNVQQNKYKIALHSNVIYAESKMQKQEVNETACLNIFRLLFL